MYADRDPGSIAMKVIALLDDPERAAAMGAAAERRSQLFDLATMLPALADAVARVDEAAHSAR
jgi:glycosyltransferase involved in cell wall biosynthesis